MYLGFVQGRLRWIAIKRACFNFVPLYLCRLPYLTVIWWKLGRSKMQSCLICASSKSLEASANNTAGCMPFWFVKDWDIICLPAFSETRSPYTGRSSSWWWESCPSSRTRSMTVCSFKTQVNSCFRFLRKNMSSLKTWSGTSCKSLTRMTSSFVQAGHSIAGSTLSIWSLITTNNTIYSLSI